MQLFTIPEGRTVHIECYGESEYESDRTTYPNVRMLRERFEQRAAHEDLFGKSEKGKFARVREHKRRETSSLGFSRKPVRRKHRDRIAAERRREFRRFKASQRAAQLSENYYESDSETGFDPAEDMDAKPTQILPHDQLICNEREPSDTDNQSDLPEIFSIAPDAFEVDALRKRRDFPYASRKRTAKRLFARSMEIDSELADDAQHRKTMILVQKCTSKIDRDSARAFCKIFCNEKMIKEEKHAAILAIFAEAFRIKAAYIQEMQKWRGSAASSESSTESNLEPKADIESGIDLSSALKNGSCNRPDVEASENSAYKPFACTQELKTEPQRREPFIQDQAVREKLNLSRRSIEQSRPTSKGTVNYGKFLSERICSVQVDRASNGSAEKSGISRKMMRPPQLASDSPLYESTVNAKILAITRVVSFEKLEKKFDLRRVTADTKIWIPKLEVVQSAQADRKCSDPGGDRASLFAIALFDGDPAIWGKLARLRALLLCLIIHSMQCMLLTGICCAPQGQAAVKICRSTLLDYWLSVDKSSNEIRAM